MELKLKQLNVFDKIRLSRLGKVAVLTAGLFVATAGFSFAQTAVGPTQSGGGSRTSGTAVGPSPSNPGNNSGTRVSGSKQNTPSPTKQSSGSHGGSGSASLQENKSDIKMGWIEGYGRYRVKSLDMIINGKQIFETRYFKIEINGEKKPLILSYEGKDINGQVHTYMGRVLDCFTVLDLNLEQAKNWKNTVAEQEMKVAPEPAPMTSDEQAMWNAIIAEINAKKDQEKAALQAAQAAEQARLMEENAKLKAQVIAEPRVQTLAPVQKAVEKPAPAPKQAEKPAPKAVEKPSPASKPVEKSAVTVQTAQSPTTQVNIYNNINNDYVPPQNEMARQDSIENKVEKLSLSQSEDETEKLSIKEIIAIVGLSTFAAFGLGAFVHGKGVKAGSKLSHQNNTFSRNATRGNRNITSGGRNSNGRGEIVRGDVL